MPVSVSPPPKTPNGCVRMLLLICPDAIRMARIASQSPGAASPLEIISCTRLALLFRMFRASEYTLKTRRLVGQDRPQIRPPSSGRSRTCAHPAAVRSRPSSRVVSVLFKAFRSAGRPAHRQCALADVRARGAQREHILRDVRDLRDLVRRHPWQIHCLRRLALVLVVVGSRVFGHQRPCRIERNEKCSRRQLQRPLRRHEIRVVHVVADRLRSHGIVHRWLNPVRRQHLRDHIAHARANMKAVHARPSARTQSAEPPRSPPNAPPAHPPPCPTPARPYAALPPGCLDRRCTPRQSSPARPQNDPGFCPCPTPGSDPSPDAPAQSGPPFHISSLPDSAPPLAQNNPSPPEHCCGRCLSRPQRRAFAPRLVPSSSDGVPRTCGFARCSSPCAGCVTEAAWLGRSRPLLRLHSTQR